MCLPFPVRVVVGSHVYFAAKTLRKGNLEEEEKKRLSNVSITYPGLEPHETNMDKQMYMSLPKH